MKPWFLPAALSTLALGILGLGGCAKGCAKKTDAAWAFVPDDPPKGDAAHGAELVKKFECNRCHDGVGEGPAVRERHCVRCHQAVAFTAGKPVFSPTGKLTEFPMEAITRWERNIPSLRDVPSLEASGKRYRRSFVERFIQNPHDLRPNLTATMPRLAMTPEEAKDLAAYLAPDDTAPFTLSGASKEKGRKLVEERACGTCHELGGAPLPVKPAAADPRDVDRTISLAPDLRHARDKWRPDALVKWLVDPKSLKSDAIMPAPGLSEAEARDVALYLFTAELAAVLPPEPPKRLPLLERPVTHAEIEKRIFRRTCWHCHADADFAFGDGGPGNTGGFGFRGIKLDLATYAGVQSGALDETGQRRSIFAKLSDGTPRVVAALLARHGEVAGKIDPAIRGMPLALPPLPMEEIQLLETWIAQGRPQ
jgi:mono/diheme cytochrome c family protein